MGRRLGPHLLPRPDHRSGHRRDLGTVPRRPPGRLRRRRLERRHLHTDHPPGAAGDVDHGGTAINTIAYVYDDGTIIVDEYHRGTAGANKPTGDDRRAALERVRAAINAELDDTPDDAGGPDPAAVLAALCRNARGIANTNDWALIWHAAQSLPRR
jgi:hypothetical protein